MNSIKIFKGYNQLPNPNATNHPSTAAATHKIPPRKTLTAVAISLTLLLTLTLAALLLSLIHESATEAPDSPSESLAAVCSVTPHPNLCVTSITTTTTTTSFNTLNLNDPEVVLALSLKASLRDLQNLTLLPRKLISKTKNDARSESALGDCGSLFGDAAGRVGDSVRAVESGLDEAKIGDLNAWISAAMTSLGTCVDGLEEVGAAAAVAGEVRERVRRSEEYLSNSLAILTNMDTLLRKFHLTLHR